MIIYKTTNLINGKIYIGQTSDKREKRYLGGGILIAKAVKEFGRNNFKKEILVQGDFNKDFSDHLEQHYIQLHASYISSIGYNIMSGGRKNGKHAESSINKIREGKIGNTWNIGRKPSENNREIVRQIAKKNKISEEKRKYLYASRLVKDFQNIKGRKNSKEFIFSILLEKKNGAILTKIAERHNKKVCFINKTVYDNNLYRNWKKEFIEINGLWK